MSEPRYVIVHGHFYQPPRESPWTGLISREAGAAPFANWNERILSECYAANLSARVTEGNVVRIRNNYQRLDFNFGPTLMSWLERHGAAVYRAALRADETSRARLGGHGNAIAQSYNHSILPLLSARDRELQIAWGVEDFRLRFGRSSDGIWLPECAVDDETLESVAATGLRFVILGSDQGCFSGDGAAGRGAGPFLWRGRVGNVAVFRFDRELSRALSTGTALFDGARLADSIAAAALELPPSAALLLAADGEMFGHHKRPGADELARAFSILERHDDLRITNCSAYLASHRASGVFESSGPSSWSCPHGLERWCSECGCRLNSRTRQAWRAPLRAAMEFVKHHADSVYERFAGDLASDPFAALKESLRLMLDSSAVAEDRFFERWRVSDPIKRERLLKLFELERAAHTTLTSCAWYFDDFGGPEGRVALRWAARTVELAAEFSASIETELLGRLREIRSNRREVADAASLYLSLKTREARGRI